MPRRPLFRFCAEVAECAAADGGSLAPALYDDNMLKTLMKVCAFFERLNYAQITRR
jgi:hypothetical protein